MVSNSELNELLQDKMAMEAVKYEDLSLVYEHLDRDLICSVIDDLCIKNLPGVFPRFVLKNKEFLNFPSPEEILSGLSNVELEIAVTPLGNADSPVDECFAKPFTTRHTLQWLLTQFKDSNRSKHYYFQSQDSNLKELCDLGCTVPQFLNLPTKVLGPQIASNLWIGVRGTTSRLHSDNFDNVYCQLSGIKRIHLIPPGFTHMLNERMLTPAVYNEDMELIEEDGPKVLFPTFNPDTDVLNGVPMYTVDLHPGDVLFMPALWYHQVTILGDDLNISANYWYQSYDDEKRWADWNFQRQISYLSKQ